MNIHTSGNLFLLRLVYDLLIDLYNIFQIENSDLDIANEKGFCLIMRLVLVVKAIEIQKNEIVMTMLLGLMNLEESKLYSLDNNINICKVQKI